MALSDTITTLGNSIINVFDARISKAMEAHESEEEKAISELEERINKLIKEV